MRKIRLTSTVVAAVTLVVVPIGATAQSSAETDAIASEAMLPAPVTLSTTDIRTFYVPGVTVESFPWGVRSKTGIRAIVTSDDPRVSGELTLIMTADRSLIGFESTEPGSAGRYTAITRIENDEGAWQGTRLGVIYPDGMEVNFGWSTGEGAYEGLSLFSSYSGAADGTDRVEQGVIWAGSPPEPPDAALLPD